MAQYIYTMNRVGKTIPPKRVILKDISLSFFPGAKIGVLGLNGSGKTSLLNIMGGLDKQFDGEARPMPGIKIGYLQQEPMLDPEKTVLQCIEEGVHEIKDLLNQFNDISQKFAEPMSDEAMNQLLDQQAKLQTQIDQCNGWDIDRVIRKTAQSLHLPPFDIQAKHLSGGEKRRVAICRLILSNPDMILMDEPTNHLDAESVAWLEIFLRDFPGTVIAVTHDRYFLDNVAEWILELDRGEGIPFKGNYSSWLEQKQARLNVEEQQEKARQKNIERELEWVRSNAKGRQAKSKARLQAFEELCSKETQKRNETLEIYIPSGPRLGDKVIDIAHLNKSFGDKILLKDLSISIPRGAIVGIIGANGAGKSTLFRMLSKQMQPDSGDIVIGETVQLAFVDQSRDALDGSKTVWQEISEGQDQITIGQYTIPSRAYVGRFNFKGNDQQKMVKDLSGGERNRLHLAKVLRSGANVLLLDEPTNDLDVETLRALEEAMLGFAGCILVTSHDRWFLDRVATHILALHGNGEYTWYDGNYSEYEQYHNKQKEKEKV